jgi:hypothetical protein
MEEDIKKTGFSSLKGVFRAHGDTNFRRWRSAVLPWRYSCVWMNG